MIEHLYLKGSKTSRFIMKSYFYKSLMVFKPKKNQPPTSEKMRLFGVIHYLKNKVGVVGFANAQGLVMF